MSIDEREINRMMTKGANLCQAQFARFKMRRVLSKNDSLSQARVPISNG